MSNNKKFIVGILISVAVLIGVFFLYPFPLENVVSSNHDLIIIYTNNNVINGIPKLQMTEYRFDGNSEEIVQLRKLLSKYSYHRNFRFFVEDDLIKGNDAGFWINLYSGEHSVTLGGNKKIRVNNHVYDIGYWGNNRNVMLMDDIRSFLIESNN